MQGLYREFIKRPSLRFLQKNMERRSEQSQIRRSARLSKVFAMRNIPLDLPEDWIPEEESREVENVAPATKNDKSSDENAKRARRALFAQQQKSKLARWQAERDRKKEDATKNKKPFISCVQPKYDPPKFLMSRLSVCPMDNKLNVQRKPTASSSAQKTASLKMQTRNTKTAASKPFVSDVSVIKPVSSGVSFAPKNFQFTYDARPTSRANGGTPAVSRSRPIASSSTPKRPEMKLSNAAIGPRRSKRIASKDQPHQASADGTFVVPRPVAQKKKVAPPESRPSLLCSPNVRISSIAQKSEDLMTFTP